MIRPFGLRDVALLRRLSLSKQGTLLHAESALTRRCRPLRGALFNLITRGEVATCVWRGENGSGFVQFLMRRRQTNGQLLYLATSPPRAANGDGAEEPALNEEAWLELVDGAVEAVGRRGGHALLADVDETGPELPLLRRAGFAVYTRQDIWMLTEQKEEVADPILRPQGEADDWDVEWLYTNTVPPLVQLVEPTPPGSGKIWVLHEDGELTAFVHVDKGSRATWLQIYIHPNAHAHSSEIISAAVRISSPKPAHPVYCCVRRYQSWLQNALDESGFALCQSQAVMVKHIATPVDKKVSDLSRLLNAQQVRPNTLLQRYRASEEVSLRGIVHRGDGSSEREEGLARGGPPPQPSP